MSLEHCKKCGTLFDCTSDINPLCPDCTDKGMSDYYRVREYLERHPRSTIFEIAEATGVDEHKVLDLVRDGRLVSPGSQGESKKCRICGSAISRGTLCSNCDISKF